ncbi:MAG TPA: hypothetical protein PKE32_05695, partial [Miltoncostaeaceae bacterium]|nr:hypothetical protein [Miltoncostaeaceae bacterium]
GDPPRQRTPTPGKLYALLIDVAGEEESAIAGEYDPAAKRDATALTVVEVTPTRDRPAYKVVDRRAWTGKKHSELLPQLTDLARNVWKARAVIIDATGVGAGLASFLTAALGPSAKGSPPATVEPFAFTSQSKSLLGWELLGLIDGGRLKEYADDGDGLTRQFWAEASACRYEVLPGPGRLLRWAVPAAAGHDDLLMSLALVSRLDLTTDTGRAIMDAIVTQQASIIAYANDFRLLMWVAIVAMPFVFLV